MRADGAYRNYMSTDSDQLEWVELDQWGRHSGKSFTGTLDELHTHLTASGPHCKVTWEGRAQVLLSRVDTHVVVRVPTTLVTLTTPWGKNRWIPRPAASSHR